MQLNLCEFEASLANTDLEQPEVHSESLSKNNNKKLNKQINLKKLYNGRQSLHGFGPGASLYSIVAI